MVCYIWQTNNRKTNTMKHFCFILMLLSFACLNAQYHKAKILMNYGGIKEGLAELPSNQLLDGTVSFKESEKANVEKITEDDIQKILYTANNGNQFLFERTNVVHLYKSFGKEIEKEKTQKHWILLIHQNDALNVYSLSQRYKLDKKGIMTSVTGAYSMWETVYFLYRRNEEDKAYIVNGKAISNNMVRNAMEMYFKDALALVERIKGKEFKKDGFPVDDIADAYAEYLKKAKE